VEVAKLPFFYHGFPQKMKNTRWEHTGDITGGQASVCRTHSVYLAKNILAGHLERLLQSDPHLRRVANFSPQILTSMRMYQPPTPTFSSVTPTSTTSSQSSSKSMSSLITHTTSSSSSSSERVACTCTGANVCSPKSNCACVKDRLWCYVTCGCRGTCSNPSNPQLHPCARQALVGRTITSADNENSTEIQPPLAHFNEPDRMIRLPCRCGSATFRQLVEEYECPECGSNFYYSFCFQCVVPVGSIWHCEECGLCRDSREFHCYTCKRCSYGPRNGNSAGSNPNDEGSSCRICNPSNKSPNSFDRADCVIC